MKWSITPVLSVLCMAFVGPVWAAQQASSAPVLVGQYKRLQDDAPVDLKSYAGKVVLVVNTASKCGFTHQYDDLEKLYAKYKAKGLVVLGFPSTSFRQEYSDNAKIADFCKNTYGIKFPMFANMEVVGPNAAPLFKALQKATGQTVQWNFNKYLISKDETRIKYFPSEVPPLGSPLEDLIVEELKR